MYLLPSSVVHTCFLWGQRICNVEFELIPFWRWGCVHWVWDKKMRGMNYYILLMYLQTIFCGILSQLCEDLGFIYMYGDCEGRLYECPNSLIIFYLINTLRWLKISSFISVGVKLVGTPLWNWFWCWMAMPTWFSMAEITWFITESSFYRQGPTCTLYKLANQLLLDQ